MASIHTNWKQFELNPGGQSGRICCICFGTDCAKDWYKGNLGFKCTKCYKKQRFQETRGPLKRLPTTTVQKEEMKKQRQKRYEEKHKEKIAEKRHMFF